MKMISRRDFLKASAVVGATAAMTACGGSSSTASSAASSTAASSEAASAAAKLDKVKVAVPNDTTNEARALRLLEANGIIKIKPGGKMVLIAPKKVVIPPLQSRSLKGNRPLEMVTTRAPTPERAFRTVGLSTAVIAGCTAW